MYQQSKDLISCSGAFFGQDKPKRTFLGPKLIVEQYTIMVTMINDYGDDGRYMLRCEKRWYLYCIVEPQSPSGAQPRQSKALPVKVLNEEFSSCSEMEREGKGGIHSAPYDLYAVSNCTNHLTQHKVVNG